MEFTELLKQFLVIAEKGSLTHAAEPLYLSQSTLTRNMSSLERQIGKKLFRRTREGFKLSEEGEEFLPKARLFLKEYEKLLKKDNVTDDPSIVRIAVPDVLDTVYFRQLLQNSLPEKELDIITVKTNKLLDIVKAGGAELFLTVSPPREKGFIYKEITTFEAFLSVHPDSPLYDKEVITREDFHSSYAVLNDYDPRFYSAMSEWIIPYQRVLVLDESLDLSLFLENPEMVFFTSDYASQEHKELCKNRRSIPYIDKMYIHIYLACPESYSQVFAFLFDSNQQTQENENRNSDLTV